MFNANGLEDLLPDDSVLVERSKQWANLFKKYIELEDEKSSIDITEIKSDEADDEGESIPPEQFEDNECKDDPNFIVKDVLEQTLQVIAKRKERWHQSGMDRLMDSFTVDMSNDKVNNWLQNNCYPEASSKGSPYKSSSGSPLQGNLFKRQQYRLDSPSDDESLQSVDTAKYILSNRKIKQNKSMTIKEYCCSRRILKKINECDETYSEIYRPKQKNNYHSNRRSSDSRIYKHPNASRSYLAYKRSHTIDNFTRRTKCSRTLLRSPQFVKYCHDHEHRKRIKVYRKKFQFQPDRYLSSSSLSEDEITPVKKFKRKSRFLKPIVQSGNLTESVRSEIVFCPEKAAHSTALNFTQNTAKVNNNNEKVPQQLNPEPQKINSEPQKVSTVKDNCDILKRNNKHSEAITIYEPGTDHNDMKVNISNGKVHITGKILEKIIGPTFFNKFVGDREFHHEFDSMSKIVFEPPDVVSSTSDSEPDILDTITKNWKGRIIEIVTEF